jgi:regulator of protease activity HflC (stomatin/prohibitin superfamily)
MRAFLAGLKAQISAAQQVRAHSGEFASLLGRGASAVQELQQQVGETRAAMLLLKQRSLKPLMQEVAELNDGHIVVVSKQSFASTVMLITSGVFAFLARQILGVHMNDGHIVVVGIVG